MTKLVVLNLGKGDLQRGFPTVTAQLWEEAHRLPIQFTGSLPAAPELPELYRRWQLLYQLLYEVLYPSLDWRKRIEIDEEEEIEIDQDDVTNISSVEFSGLCDKLHHRINTWFKSESFRHIDQKLRTKLHPSEEIRVILATEDDQVRRLPWHLWDFFEDYPKAIVGLSTPEVDRVKPLRKNPVSQIRILAILGNSEGIDVEKDRAILEQLPCAQIVFLVEPQRQELDRWLWHKQGWDILFFAGHGSSQEVQAETDRAWERRETGRIYINQTDSLTIPQLKNALRAAIARGLNLAIFNCCDGLGVARQLASLHIPQMIVMREPVPDLVAQEFLKRFLASFADGESFYQAVREAQDRLQGLEGDFPCASWLPVVCQNPAEAPIAWPKWGQGRIRPIGSSRRILPLIFNTSIVITALVIGMRSLGMLQSWELQAFDALMRSRPNEGLDQRILIVTVTDADVQAQPAKERGGASLSDRTLAQLLSQLEPFQPRVIGLDIYRENPVQAGYADLATRMQTSDRFITICKAGEENKNPGVAPPPEVPVKRLGFSDVVLDPDGILRRQLLAMAPASPCSTDKSFSFRLATRYLASVGLQPKLTPDKNLQISDIVFKNLNQNTGGYHGIDPLGHQVLLNYRSSASVATQVTATDVLKHKLSPDLVKDRIVLIGTTAESFHDSWSTPYSAGQWPHQFMPGVVVQAHMVSQILSAVLDHRPLLWVWAKWFEVFWVWTWSVVGGILAWRCWSLLRLGLAVSSALGLLYGLCFVLLMQGGWVPLIPSVLALLVTGSSVAAYLAFQSHKQR
ncbi:MAG TPA: CHASE2 domain-containing protein [Waterburya sp.]